MSVQFRLAWCAVMLMLAWTWYRGEALAERIVTFHQKLETLPEVDATDGIQHDEADLIAGTYSRLLLGPLSGCSGTTDPRLVDGVWKSEILFGFGGEQTGRWINVDPVSGGVTAAGGPTYETFGSLRRAMLVCVMLDCGN